MAESVGFLESVACASGPMPGLDLYQAADVIVGETGDCMALPELVQRGVTDQLVGRTCALLPQLPVEKGPRSWRLSTRPQIATRRLWDGIERDLDDLEQQWGNAPLIKTRLMGPWSLATRIELANGHRAVTDRGAVRDIAAIMAEAIDDHCEDLERRFGAQVVVQLHEPDAVALMQGVVTGTTDFDVIRAVHVKDQVEVLAPLVSSVQSHEHSTVVLSASSGVTVQRPESTAAAIELMRGAGATSMVINPRDLCGTEALDACGDALSSGVGIMWALPAPVLSTPTPVGELVEDPDRHAAIQLAKLIDEMGLDRSVLETSSVTQQLFTLPSTILDAARHVQHIVRVRTMLREDAGDL